MISTRRALQLLMLDLMKRREFERKMFTILQRYETERKDRPVEFSPRSVRMRDQQQLLQEEQKH